MKYNTAVEAGICPSCVVTLMENGDIEQRCISLEYEHFLVAKYRPESLIWNIMLPFAEFEHED